MRVWGALAAIGVGSLLAAVALVPSGTGAAPRLPRASPARRTITASSANRSRAAVPGLNALRHCGRDS
jgi:hypothetical protein